MTNLHYSTEDIRKWAEFSGDFNPIHFDSNRAASLGLADVPAHGMRVMLDVKAALFERAEKPSWLHFKAALRVPVLREKSYTLCLDGKSDRQNFSVLDASGETRCMTGKMATTSDSQRNECEDHNARNAIPWHSWTIQRSQLMQDVVRFSACTSESQAPWLMLDAILFSQLLIDKNLFTRVAATLSVDETCSAAELMRHAIVLQTHHATLISPLVQKISFSPDAAPGGIEAIDCRLHSPVIDGNAHEGFVIEASLDAYANNQFLLRTTVGLKVTRQ